MKQGEPFKPKPFTGIPELRSTYPLIRAVRVGGRLVLPQNTRTVVGRIEDQLRDFGSRLAKPRYRRIE
jgi:hypothetical protein